MAFRNVDIAGREIRITRPADFGAVVLFTLLVGVIMFLIASDFSHISIIGVPRFILAGIVFLVWLGTIGTLNTVTTFDPARRVITRRGLWWLPKSIPFDQAGTVAVTRHEVVDGPEGEVLRLVSADDRFGNGIILTKIYAESDPELAYIKAVVVPALEAMLDAGPVENPPSTYPDRVRSVVEAPRFFSKRGSVYRRRVFGEVWAPFLAIAIFMYFLVTSWNINGTLWNAVESLLTLYFIGIMLRISCLVELDCGRREVRVYDCLGFRLAKRFSFIQFRDVVTVREHGGGLYRGTRTEMRFHGEDMTAPLARVIVFTGKLAELMEETEDIMFAG
ncbi:MAG: hypothetical protein LIQ31_00675 [Planctomycetes bacterium]|nr:hypothetical protein [Planctomycetota bacterium]